MSDPLETLAARAEADSFFLAPVLAAYARSEGFAEADLATALGCTVGELPMLRLCRVPRSENVEFWEDVTAIAERFRIDPSRLAEAVKRGRVVLRLRTAQPGGLLKAARDHEPDPPAEAP